MPELTYREAVRDALSAAMRQDDDVFIMGEDIAEMGGSMGVTAGMLDEFGKERVRNTPISEMALAGAAIGAAMQGMRPVAEIMYEDFMTLAARSEEHTSELQSPCNLVCRLLLEKKNMHDIRDNIIHHHLERHMEESRGDDHNESTLDGIRDAHYIRHCIP